MHYMSRHSVETRLMSGKIFNDYFIANLLVNVTVKEFRKSINEVMKLFIKFTYFLFHELSGM